MKTVIKGDVGRRIGATMGEVLEVIMPEPGSRFDRSIRLQVSIDSTVPLQRGIKGGIVGHGGKSCSKRSKVYTEMISTETGCKPHRQKRSWEINRGERGILSGRRILSPQMERVLMKAKIKAAGMLKIQIVISFRNGEEIMERILRLEKRCWPRFGRKRKKKDPIKFWQ
ncbi:hypothetical protein Acr_01g0001810 [Actinidia rufa]|uniref:Uncharacterized protein n=1 Tax=Actinidia rufa TaxID=165716 RepID=A0A7J0E276_9ERIC|nr:hypothetical protein Acr_01g0001810 [Actinidia rufa]